MGTWGFFDDENDRSYDYFCDLKRKYSDWIENPDQILHDLENLPEKDDDLVVAVALRVARKGETPMMGPRSHFFPTKKKLLRGYPAPILPKNYSIKLKKLASESAQREYLSYDDDYYKHWDHPQYRKKALRMQVKLFNAK